MQQIQFCRMLFPVFLLLHIKWWCKQMEVYAVNLFHYVLACLPLKRLAKGIALKTEVLAFSWWEEIRTSVFVCLVSVPVKTPLWGIYLIPFGKGPAWEQRDRAVCLWGRSRVYVSNVQLLSPLLRQHHCHPHGCCRLHLSLHYPTRRHWGVSPGWDRALSVAPWNVGASPLSMLHSLHIAQVSAVV